MFNLNANPEESCVDTQLNLTLKNMQKQTILCVDDEIDNVQALERIFRQKYTVLKATSGREALEILDQQRGLVSLIITDQRMPEMTGVEFLSKTIEKFPDTIRILLTGYTDIESVVSAVNTGQISRYLTKPWDPVDLQATVDQAVERFVMSRELKQKNIELEKAYSELQTLDQAKNQFMVLINHELKTPLTAIISFSDLLKETHLNEDQALCLDRVQKSADRLKSLIDDVLIVVGAETKTLKSRPQPFESKTLDLELPLNLKQLLQKKSQTLQIQMLATKLIADQNLLRQVFLRLIHNAIKFGQEGTQIQLQSEMTSPHRIRFSVMNEGSTISNQVIDKILKPFFIDEDVMNHSIGMGLGLTVCQAILKAHGSQLQIENLANGVKVSFELPCL
jgi:two-component system, sensor histidine kinase and response regulator